MSVSQLVDRLLGNANHVEVRYRPTTRAINDVDDPCEEGFFGVTGNHERAHLNTSGVSRFVEEGPNVTGLVDLLDVGRERDDDGGLFAHRLLLT